MRGKHDACDGARGCRQRLQCRAHVPGVRLDEAIVRMPVANIRDRDVRGTTAHDLGARVEDILPVLRATRVRAMRGADESNRAPHAILRHLPQHVRQQRMPVAHAEVDRHVHAGGYQPRAKPLYLALRDRRERRHSTESLVVFRHLLNPLRGHAAPAQDVREERPYVGGSFRTTE